MLACILWKPAVNTTGESSHDGFDRFIKRIVVA